MGVGATGLALRTQPEPRGLPCTGEGKGTCELTCELSGWAVGGLPCCRCRRLCAQQQALSPRSCH